MDSHKNFALSLVATAPSPSTSGTSLVVTGGTGTLFPAVPFNATIWPANADATISNAEIVRVTAVSTDTLTITRAQEGTSARSVAAGDRIAATITAKTAEDIEKVDQNSQSADYTLVLTDKGKQIYHPSADTTPRTWTIPANASVAFPIGTVITFINDTSAGVITIAITTDTLVFAPYALTGSRSLAATGMACAIKLTSTRWMLTGSGIS